MTNKRTKRIGRGGIEIEDLGDIELDGALDAVIQGKTKRADDELSATTVNFRWQKPQLELVKRVAESMGVPYQTYIKLVVYKQAMADWHSITTASVTPQQFISRRPLPNAPGLVVQEPVTADYPAPANPALPRSEKNK